MSQFNAMNALAVCSTITIVKQPESKDRVFALHEVHRTATVLMPGPYDNDGKKVNLVSRYDVIGRDSYEMTYPGTKRETPDTDKAVPSGLPRKLSTLPAS
jgi:hypothetical protein